MGTTTAIAATTTTTSTRQVTTTLTTTMAMSTTTLNIEGLTPGEAALYNPALASYWDLHHCAKASDNHNWSWCWSSTGYECQQEVQVEQTLCASGKAFDWFLSQTFENRWVHFLLLHTV